MEKVKKKLPKIQDWKMYFGFYSCDIKVKARTKGEARKKSIEKLQKMSVKKLINPKSTFLDKLNNL